MHLKHGTVLQGGRYRIEKLLGQGGFGITYLAIQPALSNRKVAIKEFFMKELCNRDADTSHVRVPSVGSRELVHKFKNKFLKEAGTIAAMDSPLIVRIHDVFEENGTAYYVMEYLGEESLSKRIPSSGMPHEEAVSYIRQIGAALSYIHSQNILHLDIKPSNVLFRHGSDAVLIDFGISKHYDEDGGGQTSTSAGCVSDGYSPTEQYEADGVSSFTASTDIYSLGATFYHLLCGRRPAKASVVLNEGLDFPESVPQAYRDFIEKAMQPRRKDRPQDIAEFMTLLDKAYEQASQEVEVDETEEDAEETKIYVGGEEVPKPGEEVEVEPNEEDAGNETCEETDEEAGEKTLVHTGSNGQNDQSDTSSQPSEPAVKPEKKKSRRWMWWVLASLVVLGMLVDSASDNETVESQGSERREQGLQTATKIDNDRGEPISEETESPLLTGTHNGHEWVDLGLPSGLKWATCNVGATSPEDYGDYFAWGEISPKTEYDVSNSETYGKSKFDIAGNSKRDAARANWGGDWRMPTEAEIHELVYNCTWTRIVNDYDEYVYKVTGPNAQSIFFPAAGYLSGEALYYEGECIYIWSSGSNSDHNAYYISTYDASPSVNSASRIFGQSVRPVVGLSIH